MSDARWCDPGNHPFPYRPDDPNSAHVQMQTALSKPGQSHSIIYTLDACEEHAGALGFNPTATTKELENKSE